MPIPAFRQYEPESSTSNGWHTTVQTIATGVTAAAAVVALYKNNDRAVWILTAATVLAVVFASSRAIPLIRTLKTRASRNAVARKQRAELRRVTRRFAQFADAQDQSNIRQIIFMFGGNNEERCREIFPPDYVSGLVPLFVKNLETRPPADVDEFLLAFEQLHALIASYDNNYVLEPLRRMRAKRWRIPIIDSDLGLSSQPDPPLGDWLASLPPTYPEAARPKIKDFRERWVRLLDDTTQWIDRVGEELNQPLPSHFERPQEL
jgi:hypothetical protein